MPQVSVIMGVYNTKEYLTQSVESIIKQDFKDFEFIILDDFSTDGSFELLQDYAKKDYRIKLYRNKRNMGISFTRNRLVDLTSTNYIATQDSDDISAFNRLSLTYDFLLKNHAYSAVSGNNLIIDDKGQIVGKRSYSDDIKNVILKKSPLSHPSSMFRKDVFIKLGGYENGLNYAEDYDLWLKMYFNGYYLKNLDSNLLKLRMRAGQTKILYLKETLKNTVLLHKKYCKLGGKRNFIGGLYTYILIILYYLPNRFVLSLFKFMEYKQIKEQLH